MKSPFYNSFVAVAILVASVSPLSAQITKAPTAAEIAAKRRQVVAVYEEGARAAHEGGAVVERAKPSLLAGSDFLVGPHGFALIPKGALIGQGKMVTLSPTVPKHAKLLNWEDFYRKHRAGIRFVEISESQWLGKVPLDSLLPNLQQAQKSSFTTLTSLKGELVSLPNIRQLLDPEK